MLNQGQINARLKALQADTETAYADFRTGRINSKKFDAVMDAAEAEHKKLGESQRTLRKALGFASCASPAEFGGFAGQPAFTQHRTTKSMSEPYEQNAFAASPLHASQGQWEQLFDAARHNSNFAFSVKAPGFGSAVDKTMYGRSGVGLKAGGPDFTVEGAAGSLLPPQLIPAAFREMYEPDRLWSHLPGQAMDTQSIAYLQHTSNTNPAALTAEAEVLPDLGMNIIEKTATAIKLGATAAFSRELLDDFGSFMGFVPSEMTRAVVDSETNYVVNDPLAGILATEHILTRDAALSPSGVEAVLAGVNDIRVGTSFAKADCIVCHPTTWLDLRTTQTSTKAFLLDQWQPMDTLGESLDVFFGVKVVQNTWVPEGMAIVMDTNLSTIGFTRMGLEIAVNYMSDAVFPTFAYQWRVVERLALAIIRPTAICVVSGLASYSQGNS